MNDFQARVRELDQLPQFPAIATKVLRVLSHDDSSVREIAAFVRADAALAAGLLRIANSALYALPAPVTSIQATLIRLGFDEVKRYVLTVTTRSYFQNCIRLDLLRGLWRYSLACAWIAEELSAVCATPQGRADSAYTAALLHDIGRLGLFVLSPQNYAAVLAAPTGGRPLPERERAALGIDHCQAGGWLAQRWGLPVEVRSAAEGHHAPPSSGDFELVDVVRVAVLVADSLGFDVAPPSDAHSLPEIRAMLPHAAQYRFDPDPAALRARIADKLDAFD
ncbi:MAG TPA: HDOD domain-containing protein [Bryobacteraceae bacterium]|nr:HDOD domain-containing protein [Bryobacteraceae bacterium]